MGTSYAPFDILNLREQIKKARHPPGLFLLPRARIFHTSSQLFHSYPRGGTHVRHAPIRAAPRPVPPVLRAHRPPDPLSRNRHRRRVLLRPPPHPAHAHLHPPRRQLPPPPAHRPRLHRPSRQRDRLPPRRKIHRRKARRQTPLRLPDRQPGPGRQTPRPKTSPPTAKSRRRNPISATNFYEVSS